MTRTDDVGTLEQEIEQLIEDLRTKLPGLEVFGFPRDLDTILSSTGLPFILNYADRLTVGKASRWLRDRLGLAITGQRLESDAETGTFIYSNDGGQVLFTSLAHGVDHMRFDMAHMFGHAWVGGVGDWWRRGRKGPMVQRKTTGRVPWCDGLPSRPVRRSGKAMPSLDTLERQYDTVANALLMPREEVRRRFTEVKDPAALRRHFGVTYGVLAARLRGLDLIDARTAARLAKRRTPEKAWDVRPWCVIDRPRTATA